MLDFAAKMLVQNNFTISVMFVMIIMMSICMLGNLLG